MELYVSLLSLVVATLAVFISYHALTTSYRETLYSRQLDALSNLFVALNKHRQIINGILATNKDDTGADERIRGQMSILDGLDSQIHQAIAASIFFLPPHTLGKIADYLRMSAEVFNSAALVIEQGKTLDRGGSKKLHQSYVDAIRSARKDLHLKSLNQKADWIIERM